MDTGVMHHMSRYAAQVNRQIPRKLGLHAGLRPLNRVHIHWRVTGPELDSFPCGDLLRGTSLQQTVIKNKTSQGHHKLG